MSHLYGILNHDHARPPSSKLDDEPPPVVDHQLEVSSSAEEENSQPSDDDEVDQLLGDDYESEGEMDEDEEPPSTPTAESANDYPLEAPESNNDSTMEPISDPFPARKEEKRPEPIPRRKIEKHDRKIDLGLHDHKAHADCPDTLACLPDTHGRPQHTLPVILRCAILGSARKRLTIREIYANMENKYPYYKTAGQTWKQSVRHHLSLNRLFERQPRPVTDPGFGSYWTVNLSAPPGTKRPRKRGRPNKEGAEGTSSAKKPNPHRHQTLSQSQLQLDQPVKFQFQPQTHPAPPPPPLPQPNNGVPLRPLHHQQTMHPVILSQPPQLSQYHPTEPTPHNLPPTQPILSQPPSSSTSSASQNHHRHEQVSNQYQNQDHRQHQARPPHQNSTTPHIPHRPSLSPSITQHPQPSNSRHYSQQHQPLYPPHQRAHQDQHLERSPHSEYQHPSQIVPSQPTRPSLNHHSHSQPTEHHDVRRQPPTFPPRKGSLPMHSTRESTYPLSSRDSEVDDISITVGTRNGPTFSDDDYESEDDNDNHHHHRPTNGVFVPTKPSPIFSLPPFSLLTPPHRQELLEQMRQEIATLRRTSAEAVSTSIRLSEQLANANLEVSRSREAVRDLEDMLQDEAAKRKELEKLRILEIERRRAAEDALTSTIRSPTRVRAT